MLSYPTEPPPAPTDVRALLLTNDTVAVSWTPPTRGTTPTGYMIRYEATAGEGDSGNVTVSGGNTSSKVIIDRSRPGYTVRIVALSAHLPSSVVETVTIDGES